MKSVMAWSGGKDSACALWWLQQDERYEVAGLLTTLTEGFDRISCRQQLTLCIRGPSGRQSRFQT